MQLVYRPMTIEDIPAALAVRVSTVENMLTMEELERDYDVTPESVAEAMKLHLKGWVCEDAGNVVGFAMGDRSNGEVAVVAVLPAYEGHGIGKNLLLRVQSRLFSEGHDEIWLCATPDPNIRAYGFYRKLGWRVAGTTERGAEVMKLKKGVAAEKS
jgi:ribosomal protein S18 acetylase RimI-like enzyme